MIKRLEHILSRERAKSVLAWLHQRRWSLAALFVGVLVPLYLFGQLADEVVEHEVFVFDKPILLFVRSFTNPTLDQLMLTLSRIGYAWGVIPFDAALLVALSLKRRWAEASFWALSVGGAALLNIGTKLAFGRVRPDLWLPIAPETTFSFPSGHAMGSMALVAALIVLLWRTRWRWLVLILGGAFVLGVSFSRIYLGVHYPSDILAGWLASLAWVLGVRLLWRRRFLHNDATKEVPLTSNDPALGRD